MRRVSVLASTTLFVTVAVDLASATSDRGSYHSLGSPSLPHPYRTLAFR